MNYKVNEDYIQKVIGMKDTTDSLGYNMDLLQSYISNNIKNDDDSMMFVLAGYLSAIEDACEEVNIQLDLTYDTIENLIPSVIALAHLQNKNSYDVQRNSVTTMRTMAAYLILMAVNNHAVRVQVNKRKPQSGIGSASLWSDRYYLRMNYKRDSDFLPYAIGGINSLPMEVENGFMVDINPLLGAYSRITNVNLADFGFSNLIITFEDNQGK